MASHLVAALRLFDGNPTIWALFGLFIQILFVQKVVPHVDQLALSVSFFQFQSSVIITVDVLVDQSNFLLGIDAASGQTVIGLLAVDAESKTTFWTLTHAQLGVDDGGTLAISPRAKGDVRHRFQCCLQHLALVELVLVVIQQ